MSNRLVPLLLCLSLVACDAEPIPGTDGSITRDAALFDGGGLIDTGVGDAQTGADAGTLNDAGVRFCRADVCDPRSSLDCSGGSCLLWAEQASCESEPGGIGPEMDCTRVGDCAPGLACFRTDVGGKCRRVCCPGDGEACLEGSSCGGSGVLVDGTQTSWGTCLPVRSCDLLRPADACEVREACYIVVVDATGYTECRIEGEAPVGAPCAVPEDCAAGLFCGGLPAARRCVRICRIGEEDCLPGEGSCVGAVHTPDGLGLCTLDP